MSLILTTPAPIPGSTSVLVRTMWSYLPVHPPFVQSQAPATACHLAGGLPSDARSSCCASFRYGTARRGYTAVRRP